MSVFGPSTGMILHACLYTSCFMSEILGEVWKRRVCDCAGIKLKIWLSITFEKSSRLVAQDNVFETPRARARASLNFEHCRETVRD